MPLVFLTVLGPLSHPARLQHHALQLLCPKGGQRCRAQSNAKSPFSKGPALSRQLEAWRVRSLFGKVAALDNSSGSNSSDCSGGSCWGGCGSTACIWGIAPG
eukprot:1155540-Pelagomonas_calceolata.AAC.2